MLSLYFCEKYEHPPSYDFDMNLFRTHVIKWVMKTNNILKINIIIQVPTLKKLQLHLLTKC